jgi:L-ascorbate metabolism protein UlaG (beta-lactamase superfamily)
VAIDPFDQSFLKYPLPKNLKADIVLVTHEHKDHNNVGLIGGQPLVLRGEGGLGTHSKDGITVVGTATNHDEHSGKDRGRNTVYAFTVDGIRFCHAGDLGHVLTTEQARSIGRIDVLFVPVGGYFTLDPSRLDQVITALEPRIVVPMHYKTNFTPDLPIRGVDEFLKGRKNVKRVGSSSFEITRESLPQKPEIWVLTVK